MARIGRVLIGSLFALTIAGRASAQQPAQPSQPSDPSWKEEPKKAADPPLIPAPAAREAPQAEGPPLSTSGTDVAPVGPSGATPAPLIVDDKDEVARREARMKALEERVAADERRLRRLDERTKIWKHLRFEGFIQPQLLVQSYNTAASPNLQNGQLPEGIGANDVIAKPDGSTTNGTFFRLRRTRLRTFYETDIAKFFLQIDVLPAGGVGPGIGTIVRNAEATGIARWTKDIRTEVTAGLFFTPFRYELPEPSLRRPFIERTWFVQNVFPIERNIGVHATTYAMSDKLQVDVGVVNGQTLGERYFVSVPDLNKSKDLLGSIIYRLGSLTLGVNGYLGRGQVVDAQNLRFKQFQKWAVNYQARYQRTILKRLGESRLISELTIAQNMDTGVNYAFAVPKIPVTLSDSVGNLDERAFYVRFEQDLSPWLMAGYRFDTYSPDTAIANNARDTHAFLAVVKFSPNLRWMNELNWAIDNVHAPDTAPPSKHIVSFSTVLQAMF